MNQRMTIFIGALGAGVVFIGVLSLFLSEGFFADFLLDRNSKFMPYPVTIQNIMWLVFSIGAGELLLRYPADGPGNKADSPGTPAGGQHDLVAQAGPWRGVPARQGDHVSGAG